MPNLYFNTKALKPSSLTNNPLTLVCLILFSLNTLISNQRMMKWKTQQKS
ncbi:hypothetical protein HHE03_18290 [Helicobacter heilmannii]|nr:hypothetical protein HHE03_18290 [Helicobacter heilmannii]